MALPQFFAPISAHPTTKTLRAVQWFGGNTSLLIFPTAIQLNLQVHLFSDDGVGGYGDEIVGDSLLRPYAVQLQTKQGVLVNPDNGLVVTDQNAGKTVDVNAGLVDGDKNPLPPNIQALPPAYIDAQNNTVASPIPQIDFFTNILLSKPVVIGDTIAQIIAQDDQLYHTFDRA